MGVTSVVVVVVRLVAGNTQVCLVIFLLLSAFSTAVLTVGRAFTVRYYILHTRVRRSLCFFFRTYSRGAHTYIHSISPRYALGGTPHTYIREPTEYIHTYTRTRRPRNVCAAFVYYNILIYTHNLTTDTRRVLNTATNSAQCTRVCASRLVSDRVPCVLSV